MEFVVNEWLPDYFKPNASNEEKQKLEKFLNKFMMKNDKLFVRRPSEFLHKIERYAKIYQNNNKVYTELKKFITNILLDSERCFFVDDGEFELSDEITNKLIEGGNKISDKYLFESATMIVSGTIITTDTKLKTFMATESNFKIELLDDFLITY